MGKVFEIEDDKKLLPFYDKRMATEVAGDCLGDEFKGYIFKITGGNDKQGFPMKQGVLCNNRVKLLFKKGMSCFRERRKGARKRKSARGCIVGPDLATLQLSIARPARACRWQRSSRLTMPSDCRSTARNRRSC